METYGGQGNVWEQFLNNVKATVKEAPNSQAALQRIKSFLIAVRDCCQADLERRHIPQGVVSDIAEMAEGRSLDDSPGYYVNYVRRWGVIEGIGEAMTEAAMRSCQAVVKITRRNGRVRRAQAVNGAGLPAPSSTSPTYLPAPEQPRTRQECQWEFFYDEFGNLTLEEALDPAGRLLYRCSYSAPVPRSTQQPGLNPEGAGKGTVLPVGLGARLTTARYYLDETDIASPRTRSGAAFARITRNADGFDELLEFYDGLNRPQPDAQGWFGRKNEVGPLGLSVREICLGPDRRPMMCKDGYATREAKYDERGTILTQRFLDVRSEPVLHSEGYHKATFAWDEHNNLHTVHLFNAKDEPMASNSGFASWQASYDERGNLVGQQFFDIEGNRVLIKDGYAIWKGECDPRGNLTRVEYLNTEGKRCTARDGFAGWSATYDAAGNAEKYDFWGIDGKAVRTESGYARQTMEFDERGQVTRESYFGLDGEPCWSKDGCTGWHYVYDAKGNRIEAAAVGTDGKRAWTKNGHAGWKGEYDSRGNQTAITYWGPGGEPAEDKEGRHRIEYTYDDSGNCIRERFFDATGQPALHQGYEGWSASFDQSSGKMTEKRYEDSSSGLTPHRDGYAVERWSYDECGNNTRREFLARDGKPVKTAQGYAEWRAEYNERGYMTKQLFYGPGGAIETAASGYAGWTVTHDERGNILEMQYLDVKGDLVPNADGIVHWKAEYDAVGRRIKLLYFGTDKRPPGWAVSYDKAGNQDKLWFLDSSGNKMTWDTGVAKTTWEYDDRRNQIAAAFWTEHDERILNEEKYASWGATYDDRDNRTAKWLRDTSGKPATDKYGFKQYLFKYDERDRITQKVSITKNDEEYRTSREYDESGNRIERFSNPRFRIHSKFDKFGRQTSEARFDLNNNPQMTRTEELAWSRWEAIYDRYGRKSSEAYFDTEGAMLRLNEFEWDSGGKEAAKTIEDLQNGVRTRTRTVHSSDGDRVEVLLLDSNRKPVTDADGRNRWIEIFDLRGNRNGVQYFDAAGRAAAYHGHYGSEAWFDNTDKLIQVAYWIPQGETELLQKIFRFGPGRNTAPSLPIVESER